MSTLDYDFWLLDLDGTLVDTEWGYKRELFDRVGDELGRGFSDREVEFIWHGLTASRADLLRGYGLDPAAFWRVFDRLDEPIARAEATYLYDDAADVADIDAPVGVVTHCPPTVTERVLDRLDVRDWFDAVVCCTADVGYKPDPAPVRAAIHHLHRDLDVGEAPAGVLVGDGANDVGAAWNTGLDAIHVERHDPDLRGRCVLGDHRIRSFADLRSGAAGD